MACEQPVVAYRSGPEGPLFFNRYQAEKGGAQAYKFNLPCGTCILCRSEQARQWAVRLAHEAQTTELACFATLTYDDKHIPLYNSLSTEQVLNPQEEQTDDWQREQDRNHLSLYWKRERQHQRRNGNTNRLRYYVAGEYGDESSRPHYHACIFGTDLRDEGTYLLRGGKQPLWTSEALKKRWGLGNIAIGKLNFATARYTASYIVKKLNRKQVYRRIDENTGELIAVVQPKAYMSKNIGKDWWNRYRHFVTAHDFVVIEGKRQKPPKAHDRWLAERSEIASQMVKQQRMEHAKEETEEQTRARARNAHARAEMKSKKV